MLPDRPVMSGLDTYLEKASPQGPDLHPCWRRPGRENLQQLKAACEASSKEVEIFQQGAGARNIEVEMSECPRR